MRYELVIRLSQTHQIDVKIGYIERSERSDRNEDTKENFKDVFRSVFLCLTKNYGMPCLFFDSSTRLEEHKGLYPLANHPLANVRYNLLNDRLYLTGTFTSHITSIPNLTLYSQCEVTSPSMNAHEIYNNLYLSYCCPNISSGLYTSYVILRSPTFYSRLQVMYLFVNYPGLCLNKTMYRVDSKLYNEYIQSVNKSMEIINNI